jgi:hypothetical protein
VNSWPVMKSPNPEPVFWLLKVSSGGDFELVDA